MKKPEFSFPKPEATLLRDCYAAARVILEYGSGGSTVLAAQMPVKYVMSVESDRDFATGLQSWLQHATLPSPAIIWPVDIGPTRDWGRPLDDWTRLHRYALQIWSEPFFRHPDLILIDGRFRPACLIAACLRIEKPVTVLYDDYADRKVYHVVERLVIPTRIVGRMAEFQIVPQLWPHWTQALLHDLCTEAHSDGGSSTVNEFRSRQSLAQKTGRDPNAEQPAAAPPRIGQLSSRMARELATRMWNGYSRIAIPQLEALKADTCAPQHERAAAAWNLARWFYAHEGFPTALDNLDIYRSIFGSEEKEKLVCRILCLLNLQQYADAVVEVDRGLSRFGRTAEFVLLQSRAIRGVYIQRGGDEAEAEKLQLGLINSILSESGAVEIRMAKPSRGLRLSNLATAAESVSGKQAQKVSVIMPAYNAERTISTAIDSLLAQTWTNLEVLVVDDFSLDDTVAEVRSIAARDDRVELIRSDSNHGAYHSRNIGLAHATGDLIMVHDSDDWSHPEKVERQVRLLADNPQCKACMSYWIRVDEQLNVLGSWMATNSIFDLNFSSLLVRREVVDVIGGWDEVRVAGDAEYRSRILNGYGENAICTVKDPPFLSFALVRPDSLTQSPLTHIRTLKYGLREQYRDSYSHWHCKGAGNPAKLQMNSGKRPYVVPFGVTIAPASQLQRRYELVVVCDYGLHDETFESTLHYIFAAREAGMSVAVLHWRKYDRKGYFKLNPRLYDACVEHSIDILTIGDSVEADTVLIGCPAILHYKPDALPEVKANRLLVTVDRYASQLIDGSDQQYDPTQARTNLEELFGHEGLWIPVSGLLRRLMSEDSRYPAAYPEPWHPMITTEDWSHRPIIWNGRKRIRPIVGRHSHAASTEWPTTPETVKLAYGVGQPWDMHFLGGTKHPVKVIGFSPDNWKVYEDEAITVPQFLDGLDFFVHYPHEEYVQEFGRAILEAMAAGKPVVLPTPFKETFGDAALYADPGELSEIINHLWADEAAYVKRAEVGRAFVKQFSDLRTFPERLAKAIAYLDEIALGP